MRPCLNQITLALVVFDHVNALTLDIYCARYLIQSKRLAGVAAARPKDCIPWLVSEDINMVQLCGENNTKRMQCIANVMCDLAANSGLMQVTMTDHDMEQMVKELDAAVSVMLQQVMFQSV